MAPERDDARIARRLAACFCVLYVFFVRGYFAGTDEVGVFEISAGLYERADLTVPPGVHVVEGRGGRLYNHFGVGQAVLALPFYALGKLAEDVLPAPWLAAIAGPKIEQPTGRYGGSVEIFAVLLYAPFASGLLVGLFYLFERRLGVSRPSALVAAVLLGTTTYVAMMSVYFLQHTTEALLVLGALHAIHAWREGARRLALSAGSALASSTILVRIAAVAAAPGLVGYLLHALAHRWRRGERARAADLAAIAIPFATAVAIYVGVNYWRWQRWLWSPALAESAAFTKPFYVPLYGFLLSPGASIFAYSPLLLLLPWALPAFWRRRRPECAAVIAIVVAYLLLCSRYRFWTGLWSCPGPRYLFVATPLLMLALGFWLDEERRPVARAAVAALALAGGLTQLVLMTARWSDVVVAMNYIPYAPDMNFVFIPEMSPVLGSARLLLEHRQPDIWLGRLARGWPGQAAAPGAVLTIAVLWAVCLGVSILLLGRAMRRARPSVDACPGPERGP